MIREMADLPNPDAAPTERIFSDPIDGPIIRVFRDAGATNPSDAKSAHELGLIGNAALESLLERGIARRVRDDPNRLFIPIFYRNFFVSSAVQRLPMYMMLGFLGLVIALTVLSQLGYIHRQQSSIRRPGPAVIIRP
jgi:hypothetical protein